MSNELIDITQLTSLIKKSLPKNHIKLVAEVRQPKESRGHIYLNLKDSGGIINGTIWKFNVTDEIKNLKDGDKVTVSGKLDFYHGNGKLQLIINTLLNCEGEGELKKLYNKMKSSFEKKGFFLDSNKLKAGKIIKNILILSSKNGDAIKDFYHCIEHNNLIINDEFINVSVQGNDCPSSICSILNSDNIYEKNYDMIVITRGGGSFEDLFGFCQKELIESVYNCKIPVLSAVGHKQDTTLLDYVADYVAPTPSLAAQFIVDHNLKHYENLKSIKNNFKNELINLVHNKLSILNSYERKVIEFKNVQQNYLQKMKNEMIIYLNNQMLELDRLQNRYKLDKNIKLFSNDNEIVDYDNLIRILSQREDLFVFIEGKIVNIKDFY